MNDKPLKILLVEDNPGDVRLIREMLTEAGNDLFELEYADRLITGLRCLAEGDIDVILLDLGLPDSQRFDTFARVHAQTPEVPIILLTALDDEVLAMKAVRQGAQDYLIKGEVNSDLLSRTIRYAIERKKAQEKLQRSLKKLRRALGATIQAMALTVEMRDAYTAGHQRRVTDLARAIATEMQLSEHHIDGIRMAGTIHDIGKIGVPAEIINKPIRLTDIEFNLIKIHPLVGYNILKQIKFPWPVAKMILQHHERMNGSGYPHGLSGDAILLQARILGVADVVEAMASRRPYRPALGIDKALEEISQNRSVLYDPEVVDTCLKLFTERGFKFKKDKSSKFIY